MHMLDVTSVNCKCRIVDLQTMYLVEQFLAMIL